MEQQIERAETREAIEYYAALRRRIRASMIVVPIIPFVLLLLTGFYYFNNSLSRTTEAKFTRVAENHSQMIDSFLRERMGDLQFIMDSYGYDRLANQSTLDHVFENLQKTTDAFVDLSVFNEEGVHAPLILPFG